MDELKTLFGEDSLDYATFESKLTESGINLANLASGGYVAKSKFEKLQSDFAKYKTENDISKYADYESIKSELETLKTEKIEREFLDKVVKSGVTEKFQKFVLSEVKPLVTEQKDFDACLKDYLTNNKQFTEAEKQKGFFQKGSSSTNLHGGEPSTKDLGKKINEILRSKK